MTYVAKDFERLEEIFYRFHGVTDERYREFCEKNVPLLKKDLLDAGDVVTLLDSLPKTNVSSVQRVSLWD